MVKAVIFDFGRVISSQKPPSLFRIYEKDLGLAPGRLNQIMFESQAWQDALIGRRTAAEFWYAIGPELGLDSPEQINNFRRRYQADESINKGVFSILHKLHGRYKLAVLSNSPPGLDKWLSDWEVSGLFDVVFCSGDEGLAKPDPAVYHSTLQRLDVLPDEAVFVDDTWGHVRVAQKLGIHGIIFTNDQELERKLKHLLSWAP
ncbi:MAG: HAD family phosphatase [Desulfobacterales bacterium]|jgi:putative hydrolase of the HAD superfamily